MMPIGDREGRFFLSRPYTNNVFFLAHFLILHFISERRENASRNPEFAEMRHGDAILTLQHFIWRHGSTCGQRADDVRLFVFLSLLPRAGTGM